MQGVQDVKGAYKAIAKCLTNGSQRPLYWTERGERTNVIERVPLEYYQKKIEANLNPETNIITAGQLKEKMIAQFTNGKEYGTTTYFKDAVSRGLDENFTFKRGDVTGIVGIPNHGKSKWIEQLLLVKTVKEGLKWAFFSPESYPADEFFDGLIESLIGKSVDQRRTNVMSIEEYMYGIDFIDKHFYYVYPEGEQSIQEIEANFQYLIDEHGVSGFVIDPHNQVDHDKKLGERDDEFLSRYCKSRKRFATENQIYYFMVIHPPKLKKEASKDYDAPDIYDMNGGAMFANKLDNIITVHRPFKTSNPKDTSVEIIVGKIKKQKLVGVPGTKIFEFNVKDGRYYLDGFNPLNDNAHIPSHLTVEKKTYEELGYPKSWDEK
jgi:twinkle protein